MSENTIKKQALLIGINQYQMLPELKFARQDAEAVRESLEQNYCFTDKEIVLLTDDRPGLYKPSNRRIIQRQLKELAGQDLDLFIFGFWGHGLYRNGKRYLCPLDVMSDEVEEMGVPFDELQEALSKIRAKNTCLILDCCQTVHDRGESESMTDDEQTSLTNLARDIGLKRQEVTPEFISNVAILNSCTKGQSAYEWEAKKHGIFTAHLLDAMSRRFDSVGKIVTYLEDHVTKTAIELKKTQTPFCKQEGAISLPVDTKTAPLVTGDVFISYRHANADLVAPIEEELQRQGISYFIDRIGINYGMPYSEVIARAMEACKAVLFVWTNEANDSRDMLKEVTMASNLRKTIVPYKVGTFNVQQHHSLFYELSPISRYDVPFQTDATIEEVVRRLQQALSGIPASPIPVEPPKIQPKPTPAVSKQSNPMSVLATILEEEKRKKQEQLEELERKRREQIELLDNEAGLAFRNGQYQEVIEKLNILLQLDANNTIARQLLQLTQQREEERKQREEAERKRVVEEECRRKEILSKLLTALNQRTEEEQKRKEEAERKRAGEEIRNHKAGTRLVKNVKGVEFAFRWCPAGMFMMGSPTSEQGHYDNETQHRVTLTKGFWMMETQVTQKQWKAVMGTNPSYFKGDDLPVEQVSWNDCQKFCKKCAELGLPVCLPTEAQWEYACRAGSTTAYFWGDSLNGDKANCDGRYPCGTTTKGPYLKKTTPVKSYSPNDWGIYDMHGNVWEWCENWYTKEHFGDDATDPVGPSNGSFRVDRGGAWCSNARYCRSAFRSISSPEDRSDSLGCRVVLRGQ